MNPKKHGRFLTGVHQSTGFKDWLNDAETAAPAIPTFDPTENPNRETWIYYSGMREGYKLALSYLGVKLDE